MTNDDIREFLEREPFVAFRVHIADGTSYNVNELSFAKLARRTLRVGVDPDEAALPRRSVYIDVRHITHVEMLPPQRSGDHP